MRFPLIILAIALAGSLLVVKAEPEPVARILVPGFTARELPVRLSNVNNLRFAPDGRLFALLHAATIADASPEQLAERIGLAAQPGGSIKMRPTADGRR